MDPDDHPGFWSVLASRRMCRSFESTAVPDEHVEAIAEAAFRGPSAGNTAGFELLTLTGESVASYWEVTLPADRRASFRWPGLLRAPVLYVPVVDPQAYVDRYAEEDKRHTGLGDSVDSWSVPYWFVDGGAAVMAMLLAAEALGLGALFFGQFANEEAIRERFGIPQGLRTLGTIAVGLAEGTGRDPSRSARGGRPRPAEHIHRDRWGGT